MLFQDTSREAFESVKRGHNSQTMQVLDYIRGEEDYGATCDEVEFWMDGLHQSISAAIRLLAKHNMITKREDMNDDGDIVVSKRPTRTNRKAIVWVATPLTNVVSYPISAEANG